MDSALFLVWIGVNYDVKTSRDNLPSVSCMVSFSYNVSTDLVSCKFFGFFYYCQWCLFVSLFAFFFFFMQGSSVIRMLRSFIGDKKFQKGLEVCLFISVYVNSHWSGFFNFHSMCPSTALSQQTQIRECRGWWLVESLEPSKLTLVVNLTIIPESALIAKPAR